MWKTNAQPSDHGIQKLQINKNLMLTILQYIMYPQFQFLTPGAFCSLFSSSSVLSNAFLSPAHDNYMWK